MTWPWSVVFDPAPGDVVEWESNDGSVWWPARIRGVFDGWGTGDDVERAVVVRRDGSRVSVSMRSKPRVVIRREPETEAPVGYRLTAGRTA